MEDVEGKKIKEGDLILIPVLIRKMCYSILDSFRIVKVTRMTEKSMWVIDRSGKGKEFLIRPDSKKIYRISRKNYKIT